MNLSPDVDFHFTGIGKVVTIFVRGAHSYSQYNRKTKGHTNTPLLVCIDIPAAMLLAEFRTSCTMVYQLIRRNVFSGGVSPTAHCAGRNWPSLLRLFATWGACMEAEETAAHVLLECEGVGQYRAKHLLSPRSLPEALKNINSLLGFLEELGWQE